MPLRPVPGVIGNGAENSVELMRAGFYAGTSGATGIIEPPDLRVTELPTPGAAVRVLKGTGIIKSTYPGVFGQSYVVQEQSYTDVPVAATGSAGGATKYVYILITDTQYGGQNPPSVENGPYNDYAVTTTLPQNQPYLLLAEINQPKSTATIIGEMITDRRKVAIPRRENVVFARPRVADDSTNEIRLTGRYISGSNTEWGELFPGSLYVANTANIPTPSWATHMTITAAWMGIGVQPGQNSWGRYWIEYGDEYRNHTWPNGRQYEFSTQQFSFNSVGGNASGYREMWMLADQKTVPAKLRGKDVTFAFKAGLHPDASTTGITMDALGGLTLDITFTQKPIDSDTL